MIGAIALSLAASCSGGSVPTATNEKQIEAPPEAEASAPTIFKGQVYLFGEYHGEPGILKEELERWAEYYQKHGMRHLFIEYGSFTAEFLNIWMREDGDAILEELYEDWTGTASRNPAILEFYREIKRRFPETIFHGTDVGHQYDSTGARYLDYLEKAGLRDSPRFKQAALVIRQGQNYYAQMSDLYREIMMAENFIRELEALGDEDVMGIYGSAHTGLESLDVSGSGPSMANRLRQRYGDRIHSSDLSEYALPSEPIRIDTMVVNGKTYKAAYFGSQDLKGFNGYASREFWRLENAYEDIKSKPKTGNVLPYNNYPMRVQVGQVFAIDYHLSDGTVRREYLRSDGDTFEGLPATSQFTLSD